MTEMVGSRLFFLVCHTYNDELCTSKPAIRTGSCVRLHHGRNYADTNTVHQTLEALFTSLHGALQV